MLQLKTSDRRQPKPVTEPRSVERYIKSISRYCLNAVVVMTLLIGGAYLTVMVALERHSLQQNISFLTGDEFIHFQKLLNQARALMRASGDPNIPDYIVRPMVADIQRTIDEVRKISGQLAELHNEIGENLLERLNSRDESSEQLRADLNRRLEDFLTRTSNVASAKNEDRRQRYSFWGPIDFAVSSDNLLIQQFSELIGRAHDRADTSIDNAKLITTVLLAMLAAIVIFAAVFLFGPLKKLRKEHDRALEFESRLRQLVHIDALTGLGNRSSFNAVLSGLLSELKNEGRGFSILLIDLDRFKYVNDSFGHPAGDAVLHHVAKALKNTLRPQDVIARLGGDEFAVLLPSVSDPDTLAVIAHQTAIAVGTELCFEGRTLQVSASIGGAVAPVHATEEKNLIRIADLALYAAKGRRDAVMIFDEASLALQLEQNQLSRSLLLAADRDEFVVHYQPKISLRTGEHLGFEALVRWQHPTLGILQPGRFLPLIEGSPLVRGMTRSVIRTVGRDLRAWKDAGFAPGAIAINLPEALLVGQDGYEMLLEAIEENNLNWRDFAVEVTENVFLDRNADHILETISRFHAHGLSVSLDDFGTGFASLAHLRDFPFDELKIDRSFISAIGVDSRSEEIITAMLGLARNLGKRCVAEGIETETQRQFLSHAGCEIGQGYLFAKPEPFALAGNRLPTHGTVEAMITPGGMVTSVVYTQRGSRRTRSQTMMSGR